MTASLLRDGASLNRGGNHGNHGNYTNHGGLFVPPSAVATDEKIEPTPKLATVVEMHPATENADTDEFPAVTANSEPEPATYVDDDEEIEPPTEPDPEDFEPEPEPEPAARVTPTAPTPTPTPTPSVEVTTTLREKPVTDTAIDRFLISAFNGVYVLSVAIGLVGQIVGFIPLMGVVAAAIAGGAFELIMVTGSTVGFSRIRNNHGWTEVGFFLTISTFCAAIAAYMNFSHWEGLQATFFGFLTVVGYTLHVISHLWTSIRVRRDLQEWERESAEIKAEQKRLEEAARQEQEARLAELARQREEAEQARERQRKAAAIAAQRDELLANLPTPPRKNTKAAREVAVQYGLAHEACTPSAIARVLKNAGWVVPSETTLKNAGRDVKDALGVA